MNTKPTQRTGDCALCGHCAVTGQRIYVERDIEKTCADLVEVLKKAEKSLAFAASYKDITRARDGEIIDTSLHDVRHALTKFKALFTNQAEQAQ